MSNPSNDELRAALAGLRATKELHEEVSVYYADLTRVRYNAFLKAGFTEAQALALCAAQLSK